MSQKQYNAVRVSAGNGGWGPGFVLSPTEEKNVVLSVTGGGIHPVAARIAELTGAEAVDGFVTHMDDSRVLAAVINCGGTARIGVYPRKKISTVDVFAGEPGGPLAQFITEDLFVSAVGVRNIELVGEPASVQAGSTATEGTAGATTDMRGAAAYESGLQDRPAVGSGPAAGERARGADKRSTGILGAFSNIVVKFGSAIGHLITTLLSSGRQAINLTISTILPFMAYVSLLVGFVTYTGISQWIAAGVQPLASNPLGLILLGVITGIPVLSPILGPGAAIAQVVGVLMGTQIAAGALPVQYALPTLFAIDGQVGCDFIPVGLSLGEAKPETIAVGTPAVLFSRLITSPLAVVIAWLASFLLV
jgi:PTS system glucitol/sorbitol-specific IIC component